MKIYCLVLSLMLTLAGCTKKSEVDKELWMDTPQSQWPDFVLTNTIRFSDTTFSEIANAFLVDTGLDTVAVSCKHIFMVFEKNLGMETIDLGETFKYWDVYPKHKSDRVVRMKTLINQNAEERIGQFNTLKVRDWLLFEIDDYETSIYPLKIRFTPIKTNEVVYAIGWGDAQTNSGHPKLQKLQCIDNLGAYYYVKNISPDNQPQGLSGSPVIDKNGYLVGIVSGAEGRLGVIGHVSYLRELFDRYKIGYRIQDN
jgi:hypothetical protein